jgi:glycosyltransferase involved in cell wall biosynthesis
MRISIIIPTLNEAENLAYAIASARSDSTAEIIVVDGGSSDDTAQIAASSGAKLYVVSKGRAKQMNAGATIAKGDALLFLHADTRLPAHFDIHVSRVFNEPGIVAGAFELSLNRPERELRFIERIMEDFELVLRLRKRGRVCICPAQVLTSARRWHSVGVLKTTLINQLIIIAYSLGVAPSRIARWYY